MATLRRIYAEVAAVEPNECAQWEEVGREVTARLNAITQKVTSVLAQEDRTSEEVHYDEFLDEYVYN